jgi:hypothetical protein
LHVFSHAESRIFFKKRYENRRGLFGMRMGTCWRETVGQERARGWMIRLHLYMYKNVIHSKWIKDLNIRPETLKKNRKYTKDWHMGLHETKKLLYSKRNGHQI